MDAAQFQHLRGCDCRQSGKEYGRDTFSTLRGNVSTEVQKNVFFGEIIEERRTFRIADEGTGKDILLHLGERQDGFAKSGQAGAQKTGVHVFPPPEMA